MVPVHADHSASENPIGIETEEVGAFEVKALESQRIRKPDRD